LASAPIIAAELPARRERNEGCAGITGAIFDLDFDPVATGGHKQTCPATGPGMSNLSDFGRLSGGRGAPHPHQGDIVEFGLFGVVLGFPLARLIALIEQFDLLEVFEGLGERQLCVFKLGAKLVG
jgi:hypothetical protein